MAAAQGAPDSYSADGYVQAGVFWDGSGWQPYALGKGWLDVPFPGDGSMPEMGLGLSFSGLTFDAAQASAVFPTFYFGTGSTKVRLGLPRSAFDDAGIRGDMASPYGPFGFELDAILLESYATQMQYADIYSPGVRVDGKIGNLEASASYLYTRAKGVRSVAVSARYGTTGGISVSGAVEVVTDGVLSENGYLLGIEKDAGAMRYGLEYGDPMLGIGEYAMGYIEYDVSDRLTVGTTGLKVIGVPGYLVGVDARYELGDIMPGGSYLKGGVLADESGVQTANFAIGMGF